MRSTDKSTTSRSNSNDALVVLLDLLLEIDPSSPLSELNETSISDNNGGRIML
jgi:hypothetical protein